jgi:hypothetical protein
MSAALQRDQAAALARSNPKEAPARAKAVSEPWFRAQALAWVARFTDSDPVAVARLAAKAASDCDDDYQRSAVRAWEVAALAGQNHADHAEWALKTAVAVAEGVLPVSSRSEALFLLFQAALAIGRKQSEWVYGRLEATCPEAEHWRCKRARRHAHQILEGRSQPRPFFW